MKEEEHLAFDDPRSNSNATADGHSPRHPTPREPESAMEVAIEVHAWSQRWRTSKRAGHDGHGGCAGVPSLYSLTNLQKGCKIVYINKVVVGSSCGDVTKYVGEGLVSCRPPFILGGPCPRFCGCSQTIS